MSSGNAARVQGAGPNTGAGDPLDVNVLTSPPVTIPNPLPVSQSTSPWIVLESDVMASGSLSGNGSISISLNGQGTVGFQVTGTLNATLTIQVTDDGVNWQTTKFFWLLAQRFIPGTIGSAGNLPLTGMCCVAGFTAFRLLVSGYASGMGTFTLVGGHSPMVASAQTVFISDNGSASALADAQTNTPFIPVSDSLSTLRFLGRSEMFNGSTWDRERNNTGLVIAASASRNATFTGGTNTNYNADGLCIFFNVTVLAAGQTLTLSLQLQDAISGGFFTVTAFAAVVATGLYHYQVGPSVAVIGTLSGFAQCYLSRNWRIVVTLGGSAGNSTYSVGCNEMVGA